MRKQVEIQINDLFHLKPTLKQTILEQIRKDKRTTSTITSKKCKCSLYAAKTNLERLVDEGMIKDLGVHMINNRINRVFEIA